MNNVIDLEQRRPKKKPLTDKRVLAKKAFEDHVNAASDDNGLQQAFAAQGLILQSIAIVNRASDCRKIGYTDYADILMHTAQVIRVMAQEINNNINGGENEPD